MEVNSTTQTNTISIKNIYMNTVGTASANTTQYQNNYNSSIKKETEVSTNYKDGSIYTRELGDVSFEIKRDENLDPYSVSYEDYNNLNVESLETIFCKNTPEFDSAIGLMATTNITDDDTLNEIYFDKELETKGEGEESNLYTHTLGMISIMEYQMNTDYKDLENFLNGNPLYNSSTKHQDTFTTSEKLFDDFEKFKGYYNSDEKIKWSLDMNRILETMDEIKSLYQTKVEEKDALLEQLTKNNKPNPIESLNQEVDS